MRNRYQIGIGTNHPPRDFYASVAPRVNQTGYGWLLGDLDASTDTLDLGAIHIERLDPYDQVFLFQAAIPGAQALGARCITGTIADPDTASVAEFVYDREAVEYPGNPDLPFASLHFTLRQFRE